MHMEHARPVMDAMGFHVGQEVLMPSGKTAVVIEIKLHSIVFEYLNTPRAEQVELSRSQAKLVRI